MGLHGMSIGSLLLILVIVLLLFGTKRLRNIGTDLGNALKSFRSSMEEKEEPKAESPQEKKSQSE